MAVQPPATSARCAPALLAALADPSTYDGAPVDMHETHASWVFLTGDRAFKIKKPLALGFLDYSTLARRHGACLEEVRVNRELAPGIYLGVRAIVKTRAGFVFAPGEAPKAVEYAVEMRRFNEDDTLAGLIASGRLTSAHLEAVARRLAEFHRMAPVVPGCGAGETLEMWQKNIRELASTSGAKEWPLTLAADFAEAFMLVRSGEIELRRRAGLIRDGHGDLRCEHVLAVPTVRVVDRIEFDPSLRHGDVGCDLAFLAMDLEANGQRWAADELVSSYRDHGIDPGSEVLLAFHGAYRALVRAKVLLIAAAEHDDERRVKLLEQARSMWALSERLCWRARAPVVVVICGPPASGKSTLAAELSRRSGVEVVSSDATRKAIAGLGPTERAAPEHYSEHFTHLTYERLTQAARRTLGDRGAVIVDASCHSRAERSLLVEGLLRTVVTGLVVYCEVPLAVALERAARRMHDSTRVSDASPQIVAARYRSFQPLDEWRSACVLELGTQQPLDAQVCSVTRAVDRRLSAGPV